MAKTQQVNFGVDVAISGGGGPDALFPARTFGRRGFWFQNKGAAAMTINLPSGAKRVVAANTTWEVVEPGIIEDGAYTVSGTAAQTYSFAEYF